MDQRRQQRQDIGGEVPIYNLAYALPIPSPHFYFDNYHTLIPGVLPAVNCYFDPINQPFGFPLPLGPVTANHYSILGVQLHDFGHVNYNPGKLFTKYMLWYLEVDDHLISRICPSDLNNMPCEWDELQGGCPMLRLCEMRHKFPHPHLGEIPACMPEWLNQCRYVHNIEPTCRSLARSMRNANERGGPVQWQACQAVAEGRVCGFGHDLESARSIAIHRYWEHRQAARELGSVGFVKRDMLGRQLLKPVRPFGDKVGNPRE